MKKIVTIGGGNGQSQLLSGMCTCFSPKDYHMSSIVSMSDDGRTTGDLMRIYYRQLGKHLPPPGDLRRCLFAMSHSPWRKEFQTYLENIIEMDTPIENLELWEYFSCIGASKDFYNYFSTYLCRQSQKKEELYRWKLPLSASACGHKVGNLLMANIYYNLGHDYYAMLDCLHELLEVQANILPVTTHRAYIRAVLWNGEIIETQDCISNVAEYSSGIADIELMENSQHAYQHKNVFRAIKKADILLIWPGDIFTSIISNFVIGGVREAIKKSKARIVYIANTTNKWGETQGLTQGDIVHKIENFLGKNIDILICNNEHIPLTKKEKAFLQEHQSVKWWDFLYLSKRERNVLQERWVKIFEEKLLDHTSLYKHDTQKLAHFLKKIL